MCWSFVNKNEPIELTAKSDIVVFKDVDIRKSNGKRAISPSLYNDKLSEYELGKKYSLKKKLKVEKGDYAPFLYFINEGFHSYDVKSVNDGFPNVVCIIPRGAKYYYNGRHYVSTSIKLLRIMEEN